MKYTIPNILTLLRIALIPVFVVVYLTPVAWKNEAATLIFGLAALTDWFDGYLARKLGQMTSFGAFLDPVADKLMVAVALILILAYNPTPYGNAWVAIPVAIVIGREIAISALREWMAELGERAAVAVSVIGKIKTTSQMLSIIFLLYGEPVGELATAEIGLVLLYIAAILTIWSMLIYIKAAWPVLNHPDNH